MKIRPVLLVLACCSYPALSVADFVVKNIKLEGSQRITPETVHAYLALEPGEVLTQAGSDAVIKKLYATGFFSNVALEQHGNTLLVRLEEHPVISKVTVTGSKDLKVKEMTEAIRKLGMKEGNTYDPVMIEILKRDIEKQYQAKGKEGVQVDIKVIDKPRQRVEIAIDIQEGKPARVQTIRFEGNHAFKHSALLKQFTVAERGFLSWITKDDVYDRQKFSQDLEALRTFYLDRGYADFKIVDVQTKWSSNKRKAWVTVIVDEGVPYTLSALRIDGKLPIPEAELQKEIIAKVGEQFHRSRLTDSIKAMQQRLGEDGYAFAQIDAIPELDKENHKAAITFRIDAGRRVYLRHIEFLGNYQTQDRIVRQNILQMEGSAVSTKKLDESKTELNRTGFFEEVDYELVPVPDMLDQYDARYTVKEAKTGDIGGGLGYSNVEGLLFNALIRNRNFLGSGREVDFTFNKSSSSTVYNVGYNNPYYTISGISRGFNLYYNQTTLGKSSEVAQYATDTVGGDLHYGFPITQHSRMVAGIGIQQTELKISQYIDDLGRARVYGPTEIQDFVDSEGFHYQEMNLRLGWNYNTLDRFVFPTTGWKQHIEGMVTVPASDLNYYVLSYNTQYYRPWYKSFIGTASGTVQYGGSYEHTRVLPFFKHTFAGGSRSVRGYGEKSLGPRDSLGRPFGGNVMISGMVGMILPTPFAETQNSSVRWLYFVDGGQVYDTENTHVVRNGARVSRNPAGVRFSTGISMTWMSPLAPLVFSYGVPLNRKGKEEERRFSFTFGAMY